jgi:hypothetical protein
MADRYLRAGGPWTWATAAAWELTHDGGESVAAPVAGDAVYLVAHSGNLTLGAAAACTTLDCTGYVGTLALSTNTLTVGGNVTLASGMTVTASANGTITVNAAATITGGGLAAFPGQLSLSGTGAKSLDANGTTWGILYILGGNVTVTLTSALQCTVFSIANYGTTTVAGAFNITCDRLVCGWAGTSSLTLEAGQTVTVSTYLNLYCPKYTTVAGTFTIKSDSGGSATLLVYNGTKANCFVAGITFQDINATGSAGGFIYNWGGVDVSGNSGIRFITGDSFPAAASVLDSAHTDGTTDGTYHEATVAEVQDGVMFGADSALEGTYVGGGGAVVPIFIG